MADEPGRRAFKGLAPKGYRIRVMEPGEAPELLAIERAATALLVAAGREELAGEPPLLGAFVERILAHDVFVAENKANGTPAGFALGRDLGELYWLAELSVDPAHGRRGLGTALLAAVRARAEWFFHRALGLSTYAEVPFNAPFYEARGFVRVLRKDLPPFLLERLLSETPAGALPEDRTVMVRWL